MSNINALPSSSLTVPTRSAVNPGAAAIEADVAKDVFQQTHPDDQGLHLRPHSEGIFLQAKGDAKGTVLMFHGYTGGPWQCPEMAAKFNDAGYNVYAPRMPGHGFADANEIPNGKEIPDCHHREGWDNFINHTYEEAAELGAPVSALGLSGGGNVALRMAELHPEVGKVVAISPYLGPAVASNGAEGALFSAIRIADKLSFGLVGEALDHLKHGENVAAPNDPLPGTQGSLGSAILMNEVGYNVDHIHGDLQLITTDGDGLSGEAHDKDLFDRNGGDSHNGWYHFHKDQNVPHAMLSPIQDKVEGAATTVQDVAFNFIDKGVATQRS
jgi:pimeloyl-ACP methyl ester carboxylesterase